MTHRPRTPGRAAPAHRLLVAAVAAASLALAGCASMSESECLTADWYQQGQMDGGNGLTAQRVADHHEACSKVGVVPDLPAWRAGYERGLLEYCQPDSALAAGRAGRPYRQVCPPQMEDEFLYFHSLGNDVYTARREVDRLDTEHGKLEHKLKKTDTRAERQRLQRQLRTLDRRLRDARADLRHAERRAHR